MKYNKTPLLKTNIELTGPDQVVRGNRLRLSSKIFKSRTRNNFARLVTQRHDVFTSRVVPRWNS